MPALFKFELVSPERVLLSKDIEQAQIPGADGEFTVLSGHAPVISTLLPGVVRVIMPDGIKNIFVKGGFVEVTPTSLTVLAERAFIVDEVDPRQLDKELDAAEADMKGADSDAARAHVGRAIEELRALVKAKQGN
jgi:F-type H+-transporting ATPase subunit epsilon